jgi:hypothetical protein
MESWISPEDQNPGLRCPRRKDRNSFEANLVWTAFSSPDPNKNLFLDLHSGDFPDFLPDFNCPEKPMAECHLQLQ